MFWLIIAILRIVFYIILFKDMARTMASESIQTPHFVLSFLFFFISMDKIAFSIYTL